MTRIFLSLAGVVTLVSLTAAPVQATMLTTSPPQIQIHPETTTFTGTILKNGNSFVLSDSVNKLRYTLDNSDKVGNYEGKTVKLTGTIDMASNVIHVETIQEIV
jgi:hypothetical protein